MSKASNKDFVVRFGRYKVRASLNFKDLTLLAPRWATANLTKYKGMKLSCSALPGPS